jgi:hypothetical protein
VFQLKADIERASVMTHGLIEGQARARALFAQNPGFVGQLFHGGVPRLAKGAAGAKHHQLIFDPALHFDVRMAAVAFD